MNRRTASGAASHTPRRGASAGFSDEGPGGVRHWAVGPSLILLAALVICFGLAAGLLVVRGCEQRDEYVGTEGRP